MVPDLEILLNRLIGEKVDFVLIGGFAAVAHGSSMLTQDIDICCRFSVRNLEKICSAMSDLHPVHRMSLDRRPFRQSDKNLETYKNLYLDTDAGQLDCLSVVTGIGTYDEVEQLSIRISLPAGSCRILSLEGIIRSKNALNRPKDALTVAELRAIQEKLSKRQNSGPVEDLEAERD